jgi:hypothetical protein
MICLPLKAFEQLPSVMEIKILEFKTIKISQSQELILYRVNFSPEKEEFLLEKEDR